MYLELFRALQAEAVEYVVIGGPALELHGGGRAAGDVDIAVATDDGNLRRFLGIATRLKLRPSLPIPLEALQNVSELDTWARKRQIQGFSLRSASPGAPAANVSVRPAVPFEQLHRNRVERDVEGVRLCLASLDDIAALAAAGDQPGNSR